MCLWQITWSFPKQVFKVSAKQNKLNDCFIKSALSGLRQFLATGSPLKMMKNAFYWKSSVTLNKQNQSTAKKKVCKTSEEMHTKKKNDKR